jgi:hypothetical protein
MRRPVTACVDGIQAWAGSEALPETLPLAAWCVFRSELTTLRVAAGEGGVVWRWQQILSVAETVSLNCWDLGG